MQTIGSFSSSSGSPNGCQGNTNNVGDSSNNNRGESDHNNQVAFCGFNVYGRPAEYYGLCTRSGNVYPRIDCPPELGLERLEGGSVRAVSHPDRYLPCESTTSDSESPDVDARLQAMCQDQDRVNEGCSWSSECPPLLLAAQKQDASLVRTALLNGARISETFEGKNVLHRAAEQGSIAVLEELAKHPDFKMILNAKSDSGATPLILSVVGNNPKMTGRLVDLGASIDQTWFGKNALEYAVEKGDLDALNALKQHRDFKLILNARNTDGESPLMQAVGPKWPIIQRLLILGAKYSDN